MRKRAEPTQRTFGQRHPDAWLFFLLVGVIALTLGVFSGLSSIDARLADGLFVAILTVLAAVELHAIASKRRERRALGFNPDFYLAVERRVGEQDRPPELLVRHHSKQPEYSGWYAYADEQDESSRDLVAWSMRDLVDHSPEAAHPLRKGRGKWRWDQRQHAYRPIGHVSEDPQTA